jgi:hypothetical protein
MTDKLMKQSADYPEALYSLVKRLEYRPGWQFSLGRIDRGQGSSGLTFCALGYFPDTYDPNTMIHVYHYFIVPAAAYNEQSWRRWLLDCLLKIEQHECCEFFKIDGERPYAPHHGPGEDPYIIFEHGTDLARRTSFRGEVSDT